MLSSLSRRPVRRRSSANGRRNRVAARRRLLLESLEQRHLLAGDTIAFVDPSVWGERSVPEQLAAASEVVVLDAGRDGIQQIADYLRGRTGKSARIAERRMIQREVPGGQGAETEASRAENAPEA